MWAADDPGVRNGREALALQPTPEPVTPAAAPPRELDPAPPEPATLRDEVAHLRERVLQGDRSAADRLRDLLRRIGRGL